MAPLIGFAAFFGGWVHHNPMPPQTPPVTARSTPPTTTPPATTTPPVVSPPIVQGIGITAIDPSSGPVGTRVTLNGSGFKASDIVHFGGGAVRSDIVISDFGTKLSFTVPSSVGPYCKPNMGCPMYMMLITPGTYKVSVENTASGIKSVNSIDFTVTGASTLNIDSSASVQ